MSQKKEHELIRDCFTRFQANYQSANGQKLTQAIFAKEYVKVTPGYVSSVLRGDDYLNLEAGLKWATELGVTLDEISPRLAMQLELSRSGVPLVEHTTFKRVKVITEDTVVDWIKALSKGKAFKVDEYMHLNCPHSDETYALTCATKAMEPEIKAGSTVFVDCKTELEIDSQYALWKDDSVVYGTAQGDGLFKFENSQYPNPIFSLAEDDFVIGKIIARITYG